MHTTSACLISLLSPAHSSLSCYGKLFFSSYLRIHVILLTTGATCQMLQLLQDLIPQIAGKSLLATICYACFSTSFRLYMCNLERDTERPKSTDLLSCSSVISATLGTGRSLFSFGTWTEKKEDMLRWSTSFKNKTFFSFYS